MESKVKDGNFVTIQSWMVNDLELKGNELLIYAVIYMFSQDGEGKFTGSLQYLANWTKADKSTVVRNLKSLVEKELIVKESKVINGVTLCQYYVQNANGVFAKCNGGIGKMQTNNKEDIKDNNNLKEINKEKYFESIELNKAFTDFVDMRKEMKPVITDRAIELAKKKIIEMSNGNEAIAIAILEQSVMNGWKGLFDLKKQRVEFKGITPEDKITQIINKDEINKELEMIRKGNL